LNLFPPWTKIKGGQGGGFGQGFPGTQRGSGPNRGKATLTTGETVKGGKWMTKSYVKLPQGQKGNPHDGRSQKRG